MIQQDEIVPHSKYSGIGLIAIQFGCRQCPLYADCQRFYYVQVGRGKHLVYEACADTGLISTPYFSLSLSRRRSW